MKIVSYLVIYLSLGLMSVWAGPDDRLSALYNAAEWSTRMSYRHPATNVFSLAFIESYPCRNVTTNEMDAVSRHSHIVWESPDTEVQRSGWVEVFEKDSFADATDGLLQSFSSCSAIHPFPRAIGACAALGDICYTGHPEGCSNMFSFVRNNVFVDVYDDDPTGASNLAFRIDAAILAASTNAPAAR